jgi:hypothetical protein
VHHHTEQLCERRRHRETLIRCLIRLLDIVDSVLDEFLVAYSVQLEYLEIVKLRHAIKLFLATFPLFIRLNDENRLKQQINIREKDEEKDNHISNVM